MPHPSDLSKSQKKYIKKNFPKFLQSKSKYGVFSLLNALLYLVKTGCQWKMLPKEYPPYWSVYRFFRTRSDSGDFQSIMNQLVDKRREALNLSSEIIEGIIDSQSCRWGLSDSEKGVDGYKRVKGIKRTIIVDSNGYPLSVRVTTANVNDKKIAYIMLPDVLSLRPELKVVKADKGYSDIKLPQLKELSEVAMRCVKSNYGTSDFIPIDGRWVVERTFAWLEDYRRLNRNYERLLINAKNMTIVAFVMFMLRYVR